MTAELLGEGGSPLPGRLPAVTIGLDLLYDPKDLVGHIAENPATMLNWRKLDTYALDVV